MELRIEISDELDLSRVKKSAAEEDAEVNELPGEPKPGEIEEAITPIVAVLIGAAAVAVAKIVKDVVTEWPGGTIIDLRDSAKDQVRRSRGLPYGYVLIYAKDGEATVEVKDAPKDAMERLLATVIESATKSATDIAKALAELKNKEPKLKDTEVTTKDVPADDPEAEAA